MPPSISHQACSSNRATPRRQTIRIQLRLFSTSTSIHNNLNKPSNCSTTNLLHKVAAIIQLTIILEPTPAAAALTLRTRLTRNSSNFSTSSTSSSSSSKSPQACAPPRLTNNCSNSSRRNKRAASRSSSSRSPILLTRRRIILLLRQDSPRCRPAILSISSNNSSRPQLPP